MPWPHFYKTDEKSIAASRCATLTQTVVVKEMMMHFPSSLFMHFEQIQRETPSSSKAAMNVSDTALRRYSETNCLMRNELMEDSD